MEAQHEAAVEADYSFLRRPSDVEHLVELGRLVEVEGNADYTLSNVSFPFTRPEVLSFIEHFAVEYHEMAGEKLVVTSLTRPRALQPANAHDLSVHPAGMAVDLRVPWDPDVRKWFEKRLLEIENEGGIDVTRERHPPHYHIAVFAESYLPIAARLDTAWALASARRLDSLARVRPAPAPAPGNSSPGFNLMLGLTTVLVTTTLGVAHRRRRQAHC